MQLNPYQPMFYLQCVQVKENSFSDLLTLYTTYQQGNRTAHSLMNTNLTQIHNSCIP